jgi:hypothetical protein
MWRICESDISYWLMTYRRLDGGNKVNITATELVKKWLSLFTADNLLPKACIVQYRRGGGDG